jgi:uncharacterized membrane protein
MRPRYGAAQDLARQYGLDAGFVQRLLEMASNDEKEVRAALDRAIREGAAGRAGKYISMPVAATVGVRR